MEEIWKDIYGFEGLYQVSNLGRVKSLPRNTTKGIILKPSKGEKGYLRVCLCKDNKKENVLVHRLVAQAFIPNDDLFKTQINHKDENKENNVWTNLEWCDCKYNINYGSHNEKVSQNQKNDPNKSKQVNQYSLDGVFIQSFPSAYEIQRQLGFLCGNIRQCCNGGYFDKRRNKFVSIKQFYGFIWKYKNDDE